MATVCPLLSCWLVGKKNSLFGQAGSQYDFSKLDVGQLKDRARELEEQQRGMKKKVNPKAMNMIETYVMALSAESWL
jgi:structural maintenance of chromosome 2